jgi:hypothetical protein
MMEEELTMSKQQIKELSLKLTNNNNNNNGRKRNNLKMNDNDLLSETYNVSSSANTANTASSSISCDDESTILNESNNERDTNNYNYNNNNNNNNTNAGKWGNLYKNTYDSDFENEELENLNKLVSLYLILLEAQKIVLMILLAEV